MTGEDLAKIVEQAVLKVIEDNPVAMLVAMNMALDGDGPDAVLLMNRISAKMPTTPPPTPITAAPVVQIADAQVSDLTKALQSCLTGTRAKFVDVLIDSGLATEDFAKDIAREEAEEYCDEDKVRMIVNEAWNGA